MSGQTIDISVIIPAYQAEKRLDICYRSVKEAAKFLEEHEKSKGAITEIILVDDGSTDGTKQMCDTYALEEDTKVRHTKNCGVSHARNIGMEMAEGKYLLFVDSDDTVDREYLAKMYLEIKDKDRDMVCMFDNLPEGEELTGKDYVEHALLKKDSHVWGKIFRTEALKKNKVIFPEGLAIGEDMLFLLDMALKQFDKKFAHVIPSGGYNYFDNDEGAMKGAFKESYAHQLICWKKAEEKMREIDNGFSEETYDDLAVIQVMNAMLVVGKIACMSKTAKKTADSDMITATLSACSDLIEHGLERKRVFSKLSKGYKVKVSLFRTNKNLYLGMYGAFKRG